MTNILVANVGSTSLKFQLIRFPEERSLASGRFEKIGSEEAILSWSCGEDSGSSTEPLVDYPAAIHRMISILTTGPSPTVASLGDIAAVGFKTVIAKGFEGCVRITEEVLHGMAEYTFLAPAHNPPYIKAIRLFRDAMPDTPLVGLFEPAFHMTAPDYAKVYAVPKEWRERYGIRRYGYHGASHRYISERTPVLLGRAKEETNIISCHLGGSSSMCAIQGGKSVDTSMGFSPQSGLFHGTRHGELDPFAVLFVMQQANLSIDETVDFLTKKSGFLGLSGVSSDVRDIEKAAASGNDEARLALNAFCYDVKKQIGAYFAVLGRVDALVFTGGIGERGSGVRERTCCGLEPLGISLDGARNEENCGEEARIDTDDGKTPVWVVPTNEELIVARATAELLAVEK
ncbi:MAG: acetate/propionate family kinase [bacterium]